MRKIFIKIKFLILILKAIIKIQIHIYKLEIITFKQLKGKFIYCFVK